MKILQTEIYIKKHTKSNDNVPGNIIERDDMAMGLLNTSQVQVFKLEDNIYFTNVETDFILDILMEVWIKFDSGGKPVTVSDLYELYKKAKDCEDEEIRKSKELGAVWTLLHFNRSISKKSFVELERDLNAVLTKSSVQNN